MDERTQTAENICADVAKTLADGHRDLDLHYLVYDANEGVAGLQRHGAALAGGRGGETVQHLLADLQGDIMPSLAGVAVVRHNTMLGLATRERLLALPLFDAGLCRTPAEMRGHAWHLAWYALEARRRHHDPAFYAPLDPAVSLPRRDELGTAAANLTADIFAVIASGLLGETVPAARLGTLRARDVLRPRRGATPERQPFAIGHEAAEVGVAYARQHAAAHRNRLDFAFTVAEQVALDFDDATLETWLSFARACQDMAWRGYTPGEILYAALATGDDLTMRDLGHLTGELAAIEVSAGTSVLGDYSAFAQDAANAALHGKLVAAALQEALGDAARRGNGQPFGDAANRQNERAQIGQTIGWCAAALQAAGKAFTRAVDARHEPTAAARAEFEAEQARIAWPALRDLGTLIARRRRAGEPSLLDEAPRPGRDEPGLAVMRQSVEMSRKTTASGDLRTFRPAVARKG